MEWFDGGGVQELDPTYRGSEAGIGPLAISGQDPTLFGRSEPQAFVVRLGPQADGIRVHFHPVDQFQLVVQGSGQLGGHELRPGSLHYADAFTPYGPITPGPEGIGFFTIRTVTDAGANYMPESRSSLRASLASGASRDPQARRQFSFDLLEEASTANGQWREIIGEPDGLSVQVVHLGPSEEVETPSVGAHGAFLAIVAGGLQGADGFQGSGNLSWLDSPQQTPHTLKASELATVVAFMAEPDHS